MVGGRGKQLPEVDEERGVGARVAIDDLVVVAHTENIELRRRQQPQQQDMGRREVLELVDQQMPAPVLGPFAERAVG